MLMGARALLVILLVSLIGCGPGTSADRSASGSTARTGAAGAPKRLVIAIISEPTGFHPAVETQRLSITQAGLAYFLFPGLAVADQQEVLRATLEEVVPSTENGSWKVLPDGR